jgi:hypothetical protein
MVAWRNTLVSLDYGVRIGWSSCHKMVQFCVAKKALLQNCSGVSEPDVMVTMLKIELYGYRVKISASYLDPLDRVWINIYFALKFREAIGGLSCLECGWTCGQVFLQDASSMYTIHHPLCHAV